MNHFDQEFPKRELLAITYNTNEIFEKNSPNLTYQAYHALRRVARMIHLIPQMAVDVEVWYPNSDFEITSNTLWKQRIRAVESALVRAGVDACSIRWKTNWTHWSNRSEITLILTALTTTRHAVLQGPSQDAWRYGCPAC